MSETDARVVLLTGPPGVGKTTVIRRVVEALDEPAAGFYTEEIRDREGRKGFRIVGFDGWSRVMAHVEIGGEPRVAKYGVDVAAVDEAVARLPDVAPIYVLDEIGKMECFSDAFVDLVRRILDSDARMLATISERAGGFIARVRQHADAELVGVTRRNRDRLPGRILAWIGERGGAGGTG
ncbi:MAG: AAA family ATPase [Gemmatimonadetes bacterium]|nr:AAA family ATPase [Gemmatimonadota bacterium]NIR77139.1 AAA family ATPase [Gemmatimonadota bacterium]NIT85654.1 AAA family ATPase [Gemmatimonadota bacterium]NIU29486.1 AAA family ATPase [Gemmatimonadota bacterium]NIU34540.1 AAA family ATPase [Gemmatimonadota bacterium]